MLTWLWGATVQSTEHLQLKQDTLGWIPMAILGLFSSSWRTNVGRCGALYTLFAMNTDRNGRVCGVLVQFSQYQHRHE